MDNILGIAKRVLKIEADAVLALIERLNSNFEKAVEIIYRSKGRVVVTGMGKSGLVGKKIAATLASTGTPAFFLHPAEASHGDLGMVTSNDVIIAISNSGETEELAGLIPFLKRFNVSLISMTGSPNSTLSKAADVNLDISIKEEACPLGIVPTASTAATMAMGDALAVALLTKRGFNEEDFAFFHPGGSLGKKLFIKVGDLMHTGDALPVISPDTSMTELKEVLRVNRISGVPVLDGEQLVGVISIEDLIKALVEGDIQAPVRKRMTTRMITVRDNESVVEAVKKLVAEKIDAYGSVGKVK